MHSELIFDTKTIVRAAAAIVVAIALVWLVYEARAALGLIAVAFFFAVTLDRPTNFFQRRLFGGKRKPAAAAALLSVGSVAGGIVTAVAPVLLEQGRQIVQLVPEYLASLQAQEAGLGGFLQRFDLAAALDEAYAVVVERLIGSSQPLIEIAATLLGNLVIALLLIFTIYAMLVEGPEWVQTIKRLMPRKNRALRETIARKMHRAVTGFVAGQLLITTIAATATFIILSLLGVPHPVALSSVIWLTGLIPLIGNTMGAVVVVLVALTQSLTIALVLAAYYVVYQQFENNVLEPVVQAKTIQMTPLTVLISALIGVFLAGFIGALLALPVGGSLKILGEEYLKHRKRQHRLFT